MRPKHNNYSALRSVFKKTVFVTKGACPLRSGQLETAQRTGGRVVEGARLESV